MYEREWQEYKIRTITYWIVLLGTPPACAVTGVALVRLMDSNILFWVLAGPCFIPFLWVTYRRMYWKCPHCHRPFFMTRFTGNPLADCCVNCGLEKWATRDPSASAESDSGK